MRFGQIYSPMYIKNKALHYAEFNDETVIVNIEDQKSPPNKSPAPRSSSASSTSTATTGSGLLAAFFYSLPAFLAGAGVEAPPADPTLPKPFLIS